MKPNTPFPIRSASRAFTLIELLVVIAIIAILAAILFPVFAQAKAAAKKTQCLAQVKQVGLASTMYAGDYDDTLAPKGWGLFNPSTGIVEDHQWWGGSALDFNAGFTTTYRPEFGLFYPYMKNRALNDCPTAASDFGQSSDSVTGYGVNPNVLVASGPSVSATAMDAPADTILMADNAKTYLSGGGADLGRTETVDSPSKNQGAGAGRLMARHNRQANIAWTDGHAKSVSVTTAPESAFTGSASTASYTLSKAKGLGDRYFPSYPYDGCAATYGAGLCKEDYYYNVSKP